MFLFGFLLLGGRLRTSCDLLGGRRVLHTLCQALLLSGFARLLHTPSEACDFGGRVLLLLGGC